MTKLIKAVDDSQRVAAYGVAIHPGARALVFGGLGSAAVGCVALAAGFAKLATVTLVGGVACISLGFYQGFRAGLREAEIQMKEVQEVLHPDVVIMPAR